MKKRRFTRAEPQSRRDDSVIVSRESPKPAGQLPGADDALTSAGTGSSREVIIAMQRLQGNSFVRTLLETRESAQPAVSRRVAIGSTHAIQGNQAPSLAGVNRSEASEPESDAQRLSKSEATSAVAYTLKRYSERSIRFIQHWARVEPNGAFDKASAQAVARRQDEGGLDLVDGKLGPITLDMLIKDLDLSDGESLETAYRTSGAIHLLAELFSIDLGQALTVRFNPTLEGAVDTAFEAGTGRVVHLGDEAFEGRDELLAAVTDGLSSEAPKVELSSNRDLLTSAEEAAAVKLNKVLLVDPRSVRIIQGLLGSAPDGIFGKETVERIASLQHDEGRDATGKLDLETMELIHERLVDDENFNAAVRLILDFFNVDDRGTIEVSVDDDLRYGTSGGIGAAVTIAPLEGPGASVMRLQSSAVKPFASAVSTVVHEFEHVRQNRAGADWTTARGEFYGHSEPLIRPDLPLLPVTTFLSETARLLRLQREMTEDEKRDAWPRFERLRDVVHERAALYLANPETEEGQREVLQERLDSYDRVTEP